MSKKEEKKYPEPVVGALIVNKEGRILMARSSAKWSNKYAIPGGHVHVGEKMTDAIIREVKEETGLDIKIVAELDFSEGVYPKEFHKKSHFIYNHFICEPVDEEQEVIMSDEFNSEYEWFTLKEAQDADTLESIKKMLVAYEQYLETKNALDSWKRCQADFENYKKSQEKAREEFRKFAKMTIIEELLPVIDNFEASLAHVPQEKEENGWVQGIKYIGRQLQDILKNNGMEEIKVKIGDKFDPEVHEAVAGQGEKVKKILIKGYRLNGRVLRAAKVEVG